MQYGTLGGSGSNENLFSYCWVAPMLNRRAPLATSYRSNLNHYPFPIGRNAKMGNLVPVKVPKAKSATHIVERMPNPGRGDT